MNRIIISLVTFSILLNSVLDTATLQQLSHVNTTQSAKSPHPFIFLSGSTLDPKIDYHLLFSNKHESADGHLT